ncbi:GGDEF domain-containing protein [Pseudomarimonas arenosa]|uniref:diguanylate cyclase n=1 Tax=Pseudomarimonas arenosa TaxID=2774145 RepID=A0AAW3ZJ73_9GAMM|nr:GGDEF domain-containing protein [Pseudomarimonas arenosa]MBD8526125.1 GGDEF domain-containing protein [Pseudomarimonas arenosa]
MTPSMAAETRPWCLSIVAGGMAGQNFPLTDSVLIGRTGQVDITLGEASVSRRHCHLFRKRGGYWVADLGATNPTLVNGLQITLSPVFDGDMLRLGDLDARLLAPSNPDNPLPYGHREDSGVDSLTGIESRARFRQRMEESFDPKRGPDGLRMVALDLDHFKHVVDRFSLGAGDDALAAVGKLIQDQLPDGAYAGRIGGEEFALLLPDTGKDEAMRIAERLRTAIAAMQLLEDGEPISFTASVGVAAVRATDTKVDTLYARADSALYEAKRLGRNRVVAFPDA